MGNPVYFMLDFDGTIIDTETVFDEFDQYYLNKLLKCCGSDVVLEKRQVRAFAGNPFYIKVKQLVDQYKCEDLDAMHAVIEERESARKELFSKNIPALAKGLDEFLSVYGTKSVVVTNNIKEKVDATLSGHPELLDRFARIVYYSPAFRRKPEPDLLIEAMEIMRVHPDDAVYIGDNVSDIRAAIAAEVTPIGFIIEGLEGNEDRVQELKEAGASVVIDDLSYFLK